jgi:7,8-dihydroneopterin aldolase/epimerase/oxygenase
MDKIILSGVSLECRIGVPDAERSRPQQILVDLEIDVDTRSAAATDDINDTINYSKVLDRLEELADTSEFRLIETLAGRIAECVLRFPLATGVLLRLRKPGALASRGVAYAAVEIFRKKNPADNG